MECWKYSALDCNKKISVCSKFLQYSTHTTFLHICTKGGVKTFAKDLETSLTLLTCLLVGRPCQPVW